MRRWIASIALLFCLLCPVAAEDDLPPVYGADDGAETGDDGLPPVYGEADAGESTQQTGDGDADGEFSLEALFGEGLEFLGELDLWGRYYATDDDELGTYAQARFDLTSRSGATKVQLTLAADAFGGYDELYAEGGELQFELDRAAVSWDIDWLELTLGRQKLARGPGYLFNPSDLYNNASFTDPTVEDPGVDALSSQIYLGRFTGFELATVPARQAVDGDYGLRFFTNLGGFDLSLGYHHLGDYAPATRAHFVSCWSYGDIVVGDWDGPGLWLELGYDLPYSDELEVEEAWRLGAGLEYTFGEHVTALVEYYHDDAGAAEFADYDWTALASGERLVLGRDYLFASVDFDLGSLIVANVLGLFNPADGSGVAGPSVRFDLSNNVDATLGGFYFFGGEESEFGHNGIDLGLYRLPAYPPMAYLRVEAAF